MNLSGSVGIGGRNYKEDVKAVTDRLYQLGYRSGSLSDLVCKKRN